MKAQQKITLEEFLTHTRQHVLKNLREYTPKGGSAPAQDPDRSFREQVVKEAMGMLLKEAHTVVCDGVPIQRNTIGYTHGSLLSTDASGLASFMHKAIDGLDGLEKLRFQEWFKRRQSANQGLPGTSGPPRPGSGEFHGFP